MREILFRGKRTDNGNWVQGVPWEALNGSGWYLFQVAEIAGAERMIHVKVDSATIGQYTGLTDKNGKKIFEGDIVDLECGCDANEFWMFAYGNCGGVQNVTHEVGYMGFYLQPLSDNAIKARDYGQRDDPYYYLNAFRLSVVGNIHDNPEMYISEDIKR